MNRFLIIYIGRCGSTYLESLLNSHPNITCVDELLHPGHKYNSVKLPMNHNPEVFDNPDNFPTDPDIVFNNIKTKNNTVLIGFKLSIMHFLGNINVMKNWILKSNAKCVHIKRNNLFDLYISMKLASKNNAWTSKDGKYIDYDLDISLKNFYSYVKNWETYDTALEKIALETNGLTVSYESLNEHTQFICEKIINKIGLANNSHIFKTTFEKQNKKFLSEVLKKYE